MRRTIIACGAIFPIALVAVVVSFLLANDEARGQTTVNVDVGDNYFCNPSFANGVCETNIAVGDTVTWNWVGSATHTVTQCNDTFTTCPPPGGFDSGFLTGSGSTFPQTFNTPGSFAYQCNQHGVGMRGRVNVAAAQATPTASAGPTQPAQTGTAGPTTSATAAATRTTAPAAIPGTGGAQGDGGSSWALILSVAGAIVLIASASAGISAVRRR